ncbi:MAG: hypothetical protein Q8L41_09535 [Anaerolineales bacterium]|nr:hypothetical protein [Anaerolineales bacterium]MDP2777785.1 hypothetical protein [Anaerolineales bacterium]
MINTNITKIGLLDNAFHSLHRGYEMFNKGKQKQDPLALKEAIIWIHHGIELSIKQLLVQSNEYLIFDNVDRAVEKLSQLRKKTDMGNANALDLFDYSESITTVGFGKLIDRAAIMLNLQELAQGTTLRNKIDALTSYRNKIVHYTIEVQLDDVITLLADLVEPLLSLLEQELQDKKFVAKYASAIRRNAQLVSETYHLKYVETEKRIMRLIEKFNGQEVSGVLFGVRGKSKIILPKFDSIQKISDSKDIGFDILAKNNTDIWPVEIKLGNLNRGAVNHLIDKIRRNKSKLNENAKPWLIVLSPEKAYISGALYYKDLFTSNEADIKELEHLLNS